MQFPLKAASLVLTAVLLSIASLAQVDPCDPGGAKFGTKDCPEQEKSDLKKLPKKIGSMENEPAPSQKAARGSAPAAASASDAQPGAAAPASMANRSPAKARTMSAKAAKKSRPNAPAKKNPAKKDEAPPKN